MNTFEELFHNHNIFADNVFTETDEIGSTHHAVEEITEIWKENEPSNKPEEYGDAIFCLIHGAHKAGISITQLFVAMQRKLEINKNRKWIKNADNSYSHE